MPTCDEAPPPPPASKEARRRSMLRTLGLGALAAMADSVLTLPALAQATPTGREAADPLRSMPSKLPLARLEAAQREAVKLAWVLPDSTPITDMGLQPQGIKILSRAARALTKGDLDALGRGDLNVENVSKLSVDDLASIAKAFGRFYQPASTLAGHRRAALLIPGCCHCCCNSAS